MIGLGPTTWFGFWATAFKKMPLKGFSSYGRQRLEGGRVGLSELANREVGSCAEVGIGADWSFQLIWGTKQLLCPQPGGHSHLSFCFSQEKTSRSCCKYLLSLKCALRYYWQNSTPKIWYKTLTETLGNMHTWYLSFFLHEQNFWRMKFTLKNA